MGDRHLDFHEMAGIALEIGPPHQRPVDAGRRNLQPIGLLDRVGDVEHRRQRPRNRLAIVDLHGSIGPFGHDLDRAAVLGGDLDPHQPVAHPLQHRACDRRHARSHARLDHETRLGEQVDIHGTSSWIGHIQGQKASYLHGLKPGLNRDPAGSLNRA